MGLKGRSCDFQSFDKQSYMNLKKGGNYGN